MTSVDHIESCRQADLLSSGHHRCQCWCHDDEPVALNGTPLTVEEVEAGIGLAPPRTSDTGPAALRDDPLREALEAWRGQPAFEGQNGYTSTIMAAERMAVAIEALLDAPAPDPAPVERLCCTTPIPGCINCGLADD